MEISSARNGGQGNSRNGLLHDLTFCAEDVGLEGLEGRTEKVGEVGDRIARGDVGGLTGGIGALLGASYDVLMNGGGGGCSTVWIEALSSSSSIPDNVERSE